MHHSRREAGPNRRPSNDGLHQTGRGGAVASRPVVEARLAGEGKCWAGLLLEGD